MKPNNIAKAALASVVAVGLSAAAGEGMSPKPAEKEKCYGIAKAGKNDCHTKSHPCATQAKKDGDPQEWIYLPAGTCVKIVNGTLQGS